MPDLCVNTLRHPVDLDGGRMLLPGETDKVDLTSPHNQALLDSGALLAQGRKPPESLNSLKVDELHARAEALGLEHEDLTKPDLVKLLEDHKEES